MAVPNVQLRIVTRTAFMLRFRREHPDHTDNGHKRSLLKNKIAWQELPGARQAEVEVEARKLSNAMQRIYIDDDLISESPVTGLEEADIEAAIAYLEEPL